MCSVDVVDVSDGLQRVLRKSSHFMPIPVGHSAYLFTMLPCRDLPNFISQVPGQLVRPFAPVRVSGMFLPQAASLSTCSGCLGVPPRLCPREDPPSLLFLGKTQRGWQCSTSLFPACVQQANPSVNQALLFPPSSFR